MTQPAIAIVGMACRYPDAPSPEALWENALACRRAFRRLPDVRLRLQDYWSDDRGMADRTYGTTAAVLDGYAFDRIKYRVGASTYRSADLAHWLALDVASDALVDAGFSGGEGLPESMTGVLVGNTLTGEFSRAASLRLRWPYVRRVVEATLAAEGVPCAQRGSSLSHLEAAFKAPFPPVGAETLAGGLSNTIAGRICNHFNLKGGGYTVDAACASSLLAIAQGCSALAAGDLDVAIAGGVDLSLDPFELVGFAKAGALAADDMRIYDADPTGFWPGEGCGFVVLMRAPDAASLGCRVYAVIRGWGVSSDGRGGITRPELEGQLLALERAYRRAGFGIDSVPMFEGHGTGTAVGDATELAALSQARRRSSPAARPAAIGSIKANIGHTKAAAGVAGLLKAAMSVSRGVIPPTTGCRKPHELLAADDAVLHIVDVPMAWPSDLPLRAGVSAMGFGGINVHVTLDGSDAHRAPMNRCQPSVSAAQDAELFLFAAACAGDLRAQIEPVLARAAELSFSELTDQAIRQHARVTDAPVRVAVVAGSPAELDRLLRLACAALDSRGGLFDPGSGVFVGRRLERTRIGFLFTGQGAPVRTTGGIWARRFDEVRAIYSLARLPQQYAAEDTSIAQPAIVAASCAGLRVLERCGISGEVGIGHSLGELTALRWGGALDDEAAIGLARIRGRLMADLAEGPGSMASLATTADIAQRLLVGRAVIGAWNAPNSIVVSGPSGDVDDVIVAALEKGIAASKLPVAHAFHSSLMRGVAPPLRTAVADTALRPLSRTVASTVTGAPLPRDADIGRLLEAQLTSPVRFHDALVAAGRCDLWLEVGPGRSAATLASLCTGVPSMSIDVGGTSLRPLLTALAGAFVLGAPVIGARLAEGRFTRPFDIERPRQFLQNPCEAAGDAVAAAADSTDEHESAAANVGPASGETHTAVEDTCLLLRRLVAERTELPIAAIQPSSRFLGDLHMNSIGVSEVLAAAARELRMDPLTSPTDYANAPLQEAARALDEIRTAAPCEPREADVLAGVDTWVRALQMSEEERPLPVSTDPVSRNWRIVADPDHPLREALQSRFQRGAPGRGTVVCLSPGPQPSVAALLEAAQAELRSGQRTRFVLVQQDAGASGFARTLFLESGALDVSVVTVCFDNPRAAEWVYTEAGVANGFSEIRYDQRGRRMTPIAHMCDVTRLARQPALGPDDTLLVTGGARGIAGECALALAEKGGARLALVGRSPQDDEVVIAHLTRLCARGAVAGYYQADVIDAAAVRRVVAAIRAELGEVTAVLHAAGHNVPALVSALDETQIAAAMRPKVEGAVNLFDALDLTRLKLFVSFGSVIARTGLAGEAHYALANERLREVTERLAARASGCRPLTIEWSVWAGAGMGERLGRLDALARLGVTPIDIAGGVAMLRRLMVARVPRSSIVVSGRLGTRSTLRVARAELPFRRFLEEPRINYRDIELVADAAISATSDPYVVDHRLGADLVFPAVMELEAMAQAAQAVAGTDQVPLFEGVEFTRAIVVPEEGGLTLRTAALMDGDGGVRVSLRTAATGFQTDHARATCRWADGPLSVSDPQRWSAPAPRATMRQPAREFYGSLLFQSGRFARVAGYHRLSATECEAEIGGDSSDWFAGHLPPTLVLGDPGLRDAALHSIQACIPNRRVLPVGIDRIRVLRPLAGPCRVSARQRQEVGDDLIWDLVIVGESGVPMEVWEGVRLRAVAAIAMARMPAALLGPYLERRLPQLGHATLPRVAVTRVEGGRQPASDAALAQLFDGERPVARRADGKPEGPNGSGVSIAHAGPLAIAVTASRAVGCDLEPVCDRPDQLWSDLLGGNGATLGRLIAKEINEPGAAAATRVWAAMESLKKAGAPPRTPLLLERTLADGWVTLRAGQYIVSTWLAHPEDASLAVAVVTAS